MRPAQQIEPLTRGHTFAVTKGLDMAFVRHHGSTSVPPVEQKFVVLPSVHAVTG